jgi:hypothetical protein
MLLHFIPEKEENSKETSGKHLKKKSLHQTQDIKEEISQKFNATDVTSMDILLNIVQPERRENNMPPLSTLILIHLKKMKKEETRSIFSKKNVATNR